MSYYQILLFTLIILSTPTIANSQSCDLEINKFTNHKEGSCEYEKITIEGDTEIIDSFISAGYSEEKNGYYASILSYRDFGGSSNLMDEIGDILALVDGKKRKYDADGRLESCDCDNYEQTVIKEHATLLLTKSQAEEIAQADTVRLRVQYVPPLGGDPTSHASFTAQPLIQQVETVLKSVE